MHDSKLQPAEQQLQDFGTSVQNGEEDGRERREGIKRGEKWVQNDSIIKTKCRDSGQEMYTRYRENLWSVPGYDYLPFSLFVCL